MNMLRADGTSRLRRRTLVTVVTAAIVLAAVAVMALNSLGSTTPGFSYASCYGGRQPAQNPGSGTTSLFFVSGSSFLARTFSTTKIERTQITWTASAAAATGSQRPSSVVTVGRNKGAQALWSPSVNSGATAIAYVEGPADEIGRFGGEGRIIVSALGAQPAILGQYPSGSDPVWRPDGRQVGFVNEGSIAVMSPDGKHMHGIGGPDQVNTFTWSPNGACVAASVGQSPSRIAIVNVRSGQYRWLTPPRLQQYYPAWSPAGSEIAFDQTQPNGLYVSDLASHLTRRLSACREADCTQDLSPAWSPNGSLIAFVRSNGGPVQIYMVTASGGEVRQVTRGPLQHAGPSW
jgi:Tol biopolymer transport system component